MAESNPIHILYMEDDPGLARLVQKRLTRAGYVVDIARDGEEGLAMYAAGGYDVVAVDQTMPVLDGLEVIRILASRGPSPPIVMVTGTGDERTAVEAMKLGARDYIVKDVEGGYLELLPSVIEQVLRQQRLAEEKQRAEETLLRRTAQLEALREVSLELTAQLDLDTLLQSIASRAMELLEGSQSRLCLYRPERDVLEVTTTAIGDTAVPVGSTFRRGEDVCGQVWESGEPLIVDDYQQPCEGWQARYGIPIAAVVAVPICWGPADAGEKFLGTLVVEADIPHAFSLADAELLSLFATQAAIAVENARLFQAEREQRELAQALADATVAVSSTLDLDQVLAAVLEEVRHLLDVTAASVWLIDPQTDELVCKQATGPHSEVVRGWRLAPGAGIAGWVARTGERLVVPDTDADERYFKGVDEKTGLSLRSILTVPLRVKGGVKQDVIGVLQVVDTQVNRFGAAELELLEPLVAAAAIAIENARLFQAEREQRELAQALEEAAAVVSGTLDLDEVLDCILEQVERVVSGGAFGIMLIEDDHVRVVRWRGHERFGAEEIVSTVGWRVPKVPALQQMVETGRPVIIPDTGAYPGWVDVPGLEWLRSYVAAPIQVSGLTVGFLNVDGARPGQFGSADAQRLEAFASHAATAIENAQLYRELQAHAGQLEQRVRERTAELSAANEELARALRLKDEFLAAMSHELRTPLNAILGMSEILWREIYGSLNQKQLKSVRTIETSGRHLLNLINDILDVSKVEAGEMALELGPVSAESVCQASMRFIEQKAQAKRLRVTLTLDSVVTFLQADERRLKQILVNLLSNAVKFTPEGGAVGLEMMGDTAGHKVHFTVWDTGIGIAEEDMGRLFQPFVQLDGSLSRRYGGTGLGLWLVYRLAEMHGGSVSVESEVGKGSRFTVSLPWSLPESRPSRLEV